MIDNQKLSYIIRTVLIFILIIVIFLVNIAKKCKKNEDECKNDKAKFGGLIILLFGVAIACPGLSYIPALDIYKRNKKKGIIALIITILIGLVFIGVGSIIINIKNKKSTNSN